MSQKNLNLLSPCGGVYCKVDSISSAPGLWTDAFS
jgi:hypothetical protein